MGCFQKTTDLPFYDGILKNPDYHKRAKGLRANIIEMSQEEYLRRCESMGATLTDVDEKLVDRYLKRLQNGEMMPMPILDYNKMEQEGRHRALVAKRLERKHSEKLWNIVSTTLPDYKKRKEWLRDTQSELYF